MTTSNVLENAAEQIRNAYITGVPIAPIRSEFAPDDVRAAYEIQEINTRVWLQEGRRIVGRKIGLTSEAVQRQLKVDQPDYGALFADMCLSDGEPVTSVLQARAEAEVALVIKRNFDSPDATLDDLIESVEYVLPAIEIVGSRIAGWDITIVDTIADNASCGMFVLGTTPVRPADIELRDVEMTLELNGKIASVGSGAACLGHPYNAALWLARQMATEGTPLKAGDIVMTGALGPMVDFPIGSTVIATLQGLGTIRTRHEEAQ
jgi:2-keto-4-pentenoate hydratase